MSLAKGAITRQDWDADSEMIEPSSVRDQMDTMSKLFINRIDELFKNKEISFSDQQRLTNKYQQILDIIAQINRMQFQQILTDMDEPAKEIIEATNELNKVANKIQGFQQFFNIVSNLIELSKEIFNGISSGNVAIIGTLVRGLKDFADDLNN